MRRATWMLIVLALAFGIAMGGRLPNLDETQVVYLPEPGCPAFTPDSVDCWDPDPTVRQNYQLQIDTGGGWFSVAPLAGIARPGICVSSGNISIQSWRACCVADGQLCCSEPASSEGQRKPCEQIWDVVGKQYSDEAVEEFNAAHPPQ